MIPDNTQPFPRRCWARGGGSSTDLHGGVLGALVYRWDLLQGQPSWRPIEKAVPRMVVSSHVQGAYLFLTFIAGILGFLS